MFHPRLDHSESLGFPILQDGIPVRRESARLHQDGIPLRRDVARHLPIPIPILPIHHRPQSLHPRIASQRQTARGHFSRVNSARKCTSHKPRPRAMILWAATRNPTFKHSAHGRERTSVNTGGTTSSRSSERSRMRRGLKVGAGPCRRGDGCGALRPLLCFMPHGSLGKMLEFFAAFR
jgi:hypothetical protein